jgi:predicted GTPase
VVGSSKRKILQQQHKRTRTPKATMLMVMAKELQQPQQRKRHSNGYGVLQQTHTPAVVALASKHAWHSSDALR